jgi:hypothetical protein
MEGTKQEVLHLYNLLQHHDKWYLKVQCPQIEEIIEIADRAEEYATLKLQNISFPALYSRYRKWVKGDPIIAPDQHYYYEFLSDIAYDMALEGLRREEKYIFEDICSVTIKFL